MCFCQYKIRFVLPDQRDEKLPLASKKTLFLLQEKESKDGPPPKWGTEQDTSHRGKLAWLKVVITLPLV